MKFKLLIYILENIVHSFIDKILYKVDQSYNIIVCINNINNIDILFKILKKHIFLKLNILNDCFVIDRPWNHLRYELNYSLLSLKYNYRLVIKFFILQNYFVKSINRIFSNALWIEREIWDMFGIIFINHTDLRRLLTDYSFDGYPLKKDFPLTGYVELQYDDNLLSLKYVPIELTQDYRIFSFLSPWEVIHI